MTEPEAIIYMLPIAFGLAIILSLWGAEWKL